jgi:hypothetical protein
MMDNAYRGLTKKNDFTIKRKKVRLMNPIHSCKKYIDFKNHFTELG